MKHFPTGALVFAQSRRPAPIALPEAVLRGAAHVQAAARAEAEASRGDPANGEQIVRDVQAALNDFRERESARVDALQAELDRMASADAAREMGVANAARPVEPDYTRAFAGFFRTGDGEGDLRARNASGDRGAIRAAMSEGVDNAGGYLAPVEWDRNVGQRLRILSPMRRLATVRQTSVRGYSTVWSDGLWGTGWVGETAARPQTTTPGLSTLQFVAGQLYAFPQITQDLLDDAQFDIAGWLNDEISQVFAVQEGTAFVGGTGVNQPRGFLTYVPGGASDGVHPGGNLTLVPSQSANGLTPDGLVDFVYSLPSPYRTGAAWLMNSVTAATIAKMKDGQGNYLWSRAIAATAPDTLLGYPVEISEDMPNVAANTTPVAFGNFARGYVINDRAGVSVLRDPYTNKPFVGFYTRKRVGGGVWDPNAIRLLKVSAS